MRVIYDRGTFFPMETITSPLVEEIRKELRNQNRSQAWLARQINMNKNVLNHRMTGRVKFAALEVQSIAQALEVPVGQLLEVSA